jgi:hypothetical protein
LVVPAIVTATVKGKSATANVKLHLPQISLASSKAEVVNDNANPTLFAFGKTDYPNLSTDYHVPALVIPHHEILGLLYQYTPYSINLDLTSQLTLPAAWAVTTRPRPESGILGSEGTPHATFSNAFVGGIYQHIIATKGVTSTTNLILPPAGAEVKRIVFNDLRSADVWVANVKKTYTVGQYSSRQFL